MSKNRLDESTIRRFMGLAGIQPLGENFLDRLQEEEPEEVPMDDMAAEEPPMDAEPAPEMDAEEPALEETANTTEAEEETLEENTPEDDALTQLETVTNDLEEKEEVVQEVARRVVKRLLDTIQK